jgi:drug/metabolite transporter (DMT)-like permease
VPSNGCSNWKGTALSAKNWLKFILLGLVWGSSFLWIKLALGEVSPFVVVFFRAGIAFLGLSVVWVVNRVKLRWQDWWKFAIMGVFNHAFPIVLICWSETHISSGLAAILNSTTPLFTILIAPLFLSDERITLQRVLGLVIGFAGVIVLASNDMKSEDALSGVGIITMLVAATSYAASGVFVRKAMTGISHEAQSIGQMGMAFLVMIPTVLIADPSFHLPTHTITWVSLVWLGLLGTCITLLVWFSLLNSVGPLKTSMVTYMFPLVGVFLGWIFLHEEPNWRLLVGGVLVILAVVIVNSLGRKNQVKIEVQDFPLENTEIHDGREN